MRHLFSFMHLIIHKSVIYNTNNLQKVLIDICFLKLTRMVQQDRVERGMMSLKWSPHSPNLQIMYLNISTSNELFCWFYTVHVFSTLPTTQYVLKIFTDYDND